MLVIVWHQLRYMEVTTRTTHSRSSLHKLFRQWENYPLTFYLQGEDGIPLDDLIGLGGDFKSPGGDNRGPPPPSQPPGGGGGGYPPPSGGGGGGGGAYPAAQYPPEPAVAYPPQNMPQQTPVVYPTPQPSYPPPQNTDPA